MGNTTRHAGERLRRRLLDEAVQENVETLRGDWFHRRRRRRSQEARRRRRERDKPVWQRASVWVLLVLGAGLVSATSYVSWKTFGSLPETVVEVPLAPVADPLAANLDNLAYRAPTVSDRALFPLSVRTVVLDPGHGGDNRGTVGDSGLQEKEVTLEIADMLRGMLEAASYRVLMTREADASVSLEERAGLANRLRGDIFVSIHVNWLVNRRARGVETYYLGPTDDEFLQELVAAENLDSGYTLAHFRRMLERVYADVRGEDSRALAESVQEQLHLALSKVNPGLIDRGVKTAPFVVLTGTQMPAILAEVSCLSNAQEEALLKEDAYREYIAEALFRGIHNYAEKLNQANHRGVE